MKRKPNNAASSRKAAANQLNADGRVSPLVAIQERMEYHRDLALAELAKGSEGDPETIRVHLQYAQESAVELAPYRHPRLQATAVVHGGEDELAEMLREINGTSRGLPRFNRLDDDETTQH